MADIYRLASQYDTIFDPVAYADRYGRLTEYKGLDVHVKVQQGMLKQHSKKVGISPIVITFSAFFYIFIRLFSYYSCIMPIFIYY